MADTQKTLIICFAIFFYLYIIYKRNLFSSFDYGILSSN